MTKVHPILPIRQESPESNDKETTGWTTSELNELFDDSISGDEWELQLLPIPTDQDPMSKERLLKNNTTKLVQRFDHRFTTPLPVLRKLGRGPLSQVTIELMQTISHPGTSCTRKLHLAQDSVTKGHQGIRNSYDTLRRDVYCPKLFGNVRKYVNPCRTCTQSRGIL